MIDLTNVRVIDGEIEVACVYCELKYKLPVSENELDRWQGGELIQSVFPHLTDSQRELLISGICETCWVFFPLLGVFPW